MRTGLIPSEMFAATGWRVGWLIGPPDLIRPTLAATTRIVFATNSPLQEAAAAGLEEARERKYFETSLVEYTERREVLAKVFRKLGLPFTLPEGSYFLLLVRFGFRTVAKMQLSDMEDAGHFPREDSRGLQLACYDQRERERLQVSRRSICGES